MDEKSFNLKKILDNFANLKSVAVMQHLYLITYNYLPFSCISRISEESSSLVDRNKKWDPASGTKI